MSTSYIECHFCGCTYYLRGSRPTWHEMWKEITGEGWVIDEYRHWKCPKCQKEDNDNG